MVIRSQGGFLRILWGISLFDSQEESNPKIIAIGNVNTISVGISNNKSGNSIIFETKYLVINVVNCMKIVKTSAEITRSNASGFR
ncbi:MAG: hypothetical protein F4094_05295 [Synechococcus sp. SB0672_bin_6]|nr:hypothetical protein [Synechococcus sp. SB0672_bin_6]